MSSRGKDFRSPSPLAADSRKQYGTSRPKKMAQVAPLQSSAQVPFQSAKLQTKHSSWTPILHKPSNEQMYIERRDLIGHWFDMWTDVQRKRFLRYILNRCKRSQVLFLHKFFNDNIPVTHADFTNILPRFLSLYIFSFLDPRSLSRAGMVCWHWKFLTEQDSIWTPKCMRQGWFLPYTPKRNEYGAWKIHYIKCLQTLDVAHPTEKSNLYGRMSDGSRQLEKEQRERRKKALEARNADKQTTLTWRERPPWLDPDPKPMDLEHAHNNLTGSANPEWDPARTRGHLRSFTEPSARSFDYGLDSANRKKHHRATSEFEQTFGADTSGLKTLSSSVAEEAAMELGGALEQSWPKLSQSSLYRRKDLSRGGAGDYSSGFSPVTSAASGAKMRKAQAQRLVVIASNVHAYEILVAAARPGVQCICYDYNSTTMESLLQMMQETLEHIQPIRSVLFVTTGTEVAELTEDSVLSDQTLESPEMKNFWECICMWMGSAGDASKGAKHIGFFAPLAATERGTALMTELSRLTGLEIVAPDVICRDQFSHVTSIWSSSPEKTTLPSLLYFVDDKLHSWEVLAGRSKEAIKLCRSHMGKFFQDKMGYDLIKLTGAIILEELGDDTEDIANKLVPVVQAAVQALAEADVKPEESVSFIGEYLLKTTNHQSQAKPSLRTEINVKTTSTTAEKPSLKAGASNLWMKSDSIKFGSDAESVGEDIDEDSIPEEMDDNMNVAKHETLMNAKTFALSQTQSATYIISPKETLPLQRSSEPKDMEPLQPLSRKGMFTQIVISERDYVQKLDIMHDVYYRRLQAAIQSNKAITSQPNLDLIFLDVNTIRGIHRSFLEELESRLSEWNVQQCVGDCFIKLQGKLKAYTNFHNNYPVILSTADKCREQEPYFRSFLKRFDNSPDTKMLSLQELLLLPASRISEYVRILIHQEHCTAVDHTDREDLAAAIQTFKLLDQKIEKDRRRGEMERSLQALQLQVTGCPTLLEANRHLIKEEHVAQIRVEATGSTAGSFQHVHDICFFLFNDALMVTTETKRHIPYTRQMELCYRFQAAVSLTKLLIEDVPDSQYASNVFVLKTPKRQWMCSSKSYGAKLAWMTILEATVKAAMDVD